MKIHEYQAKEILRRYGVATPRGRVTDDPGEARAICEELGGKCVVKAQIHAGGRGKGGGVKLAKSPRGGARTGRRRSSACSCVTPQTGPEGQKVQKVLIEEAADIAQELYLAVHARPRDRASRSSWPRRPAAWTSRRWRQATPRRSCASAGRSAPRRCMPFQARKRRLRPRARGRYGAQGAALVTALVKAYLDTDASLAEINPLMITRQGDVVALDAKINFDDNALFRHADIVAMRDLAEENPLEVEASKHNLNYIKLDGTIGCMVNGAGLAMATMDIIKLYGGEPANFLDVGGSALAGGGRRTPSASWSPTRRSRRC